MLIQTQTHTIYCRQSLHTCTLSLLSQDYRLLPISGWDTPANVSKRLYGWLRLWWWTLWQCVSRSQGIHWEAAHQTASVSWEQWQQAMALLFPLQHDGVGGYYINLVKMQTLNLLSMLYTEQGLLLLYARWRCRLDWVSFPDRQQDPQYCTEGLGTRQTEMQHETLAVQ